MKQTINKRRIIRESKKMQIAALVVSLLAVAGAIWTRDRYSPFRFWAAIIFFSGGGLFLLVRLLNPKNLFVPHGTKLRKEIPAAGFHQAQEDLGFFSYTDGGFNFKEQNALTFYKWSDIETVFGFKDDQYTTGEICMDIFTIDHSHLRLTASTPGWHQFNKRLSENIQGIHSNWDTEIVAPALETKLTLLYDKKGRTLQEAEVVCYAE